MIKVHKKQLIFMYKIYINILVILKNYEVLKILH